MSNKNGAKGPGKHTQPCCSRYSYAANKALKAERHLRHMAYFVRRRAKIATRKADARLAEAMGVAVAA